MFLPRLCALVLAALLPLSPPARAEDVSTLSYDARLGGYAYAFDVKFFPLSSQGQSLEMAYVHLPGEAGKPVVTLLHGKNFNADYWAGTARHLQKLGYGVLIPDQIGFGKSSKPVQYQYSFPTLARHTRALMASLGIERSIVVGHSMGGMLASRFALMYPQAVQRLVLVNPIGLENYLKYVEHKDTDFLYGVEQKQTADSIAKYQRDNYYDGQWNERYAALTRFMIGQMQGPDRNQVAWVNALTRGLLALNRGPRANPDASGSRRADAG